MTTLKERYDQQHTAGALAHGMLAALLQHNYLPEFIRDEAQRIVDAWPKYEPETEAEQAALRG
jgi:hypothetical protein